MRSHSGDSSIFETDPCPLIRQNLRLDKIMNEAGSPGESSEASGGKVQKHIGKVERSCCWTCGALDPQNSLDCFKLIIRMPAEVLLTLQASLVDNLLGDHLIFEQIDDEEAEMV
ncbi:uncharacterized protein LOC130140161 isoform X1 [Syzygium oleosum]|uniref:uncharacterized protein LOC130140159 n=1 Tax=Syzygium oleosum TaxID=219896 RepID=UPI0024B8F8AC|nr:uncharacterized protein LOC130140159 [Syzygium oleosum]XP_056174765.1 uncharacterized protein LOC130140161 isoform X1 [Syzygium oleosum]